MRSRKIYPHLELAVLSTQYAGLKRKDKINLPFITCKGFQIINSVLCTYSDNDQSMFLHKLKFIFDYFILVYAWF